MSRNIQERVINHALCTACGACAGICPVGAISMEENAAGFLSAVVNSQQCINCGKCLNCCPSVAENKRIEELYRDLHGVAIAGFIGHAVEKRIRYEGQSGGVVTSLLLYLLETGKIDGAITNQFDPERRRSKATYVDTKQGLLESCGSYYTQSAVVERAREHSHKRLAAVVLGCQAEAIKLLEQQGHNKPEYLLGLICAGQNSGHMIDELIQKSGCSDEEQPQKFRFRYSHPAYGNWPGNILMVTDKRRYTLDKSCRHALKPFYEAYRCLLCYDQMCVEADLVFGDPWGIEGDHSVGETVIIAYTEKGLSLLKEAEAAGYVAIEDLAVEKIMAGETVDTQHLPKVACGYSICKEKSWEYPYTLSPSADQELQSHVSKKKRKQYLRRLEYTWERCLAKTPSDAYAIKEAYKESLEKSENIQKWRSRLLLPLRCIRYILRKV